MLQAKNQNTSFPQNQINVYTSCYSTYNSPPSHPTPTAYQSYPLTPEVMHAHCGHLHFHENLQRNQTCHDFLRLRIQAVILYGWCSHHTSSCGVSIFIYHSNHIYVKCETVAYSKTHMNISQIMEIIWCTKIYNTQSQSYPWHDILWLTRISIHHARHPHYRSIPSIPRYVAPLD